MLRVRVRSICNVRGLVALALLAVALLWACAPAQAGTDYTWTGGGGDGAWSTAGNWLPSTGVPGDASGDTALFNDTGTLKAVTGTTSAINGVAITVAGTRTWTFSVVIQSTSSLTISGTGALRLSGLNTYSGDTTISSGTLDLRASNAIPSGAGKGNIVVNGTLDLNGYDQIVNGLSGTGVVKHSHTSGNNNDSILTVGSNDWTSTFGGVIQNGSDKGVALIKTGTGTLTLTGANTYTGSTTISGGTLQLGDGTSGHDGTIASYNNIDNAALVFDYFGAVTYPNAIGGSGTVTKTGPNTLTVTGAIGCPTTISTGTLQVGDGTSSNGSVAADIVNNSALVFNYSGGAIVTYSHVISGSGTVTVKGANTLARPLVLSGINTYSGDTTVNAGTTLAAGATNAIPSGPGKGNLIVNGTFDVNYGGGPGFTQTINGLSGGGTVTNSGYNNNSGSILTVGGNDWTSTFSGVITDGNKPLGLIKIGAGTLILTGANTIGLWPELTAINGGTLQLGDGTSGHDGTVSSYYIYDNAALVFNYFGTVTCANIITGTGTVTKTGPGTVTLTGANTYTGLTTVSAGTLAYGASNVIASGAVTVNGPTAILDLGAGHTDTVGTVTVDGGGSIIGTGIAALTSTGTFEMMNGTVSAILAGGGIALNKTTTGMVTLSGANTYTGLTTVGAGVLAVTGSLAASSAVIVNSGGTLSGTGTVNGSVSVAGLVAPGISGTPGTLTVGSADFATNGGKLNLRVPANTSGGFDELVSLGTVTLGLSPAPKTGLILDLTGYSGSTPDGGLTIVHAATGRSGYLGLDDSSNLAGKAPSDIALRYDDSDFPYSINLGISNGNVTPVTVDSFAARAEGAGVLLAWHVTSEFQNLGFNVYRSTDGGRNWRKVNGALVPGRITQANAKSYCLYDWAAVGGDEYKLESVSLAGVKGTYGELASVDQGQPCCWPAVTVDGFEAALASLYSEFTARGAGNGHPNR